MKNTMYRFIALPLLSLVLLAGVAPAAYAACGTCCKDTCKTCCGSNCASCCKK